VSLLAQGRDIPFWPNAVPEAIHAEIDGMATLQTVRELGQFHRVHGSPQFAAAAELMRRKAVAAGLSNVEVWHFKSDGTTRYAHFRSYSGWNPVEATLDEVSPTPHRMESWPETPVALADYSQDADVTATVVDVGRGTSPTDYDKKDVKGKLVLADGPLDAVHRRAVEERGAAGILSDFPNQTTAWSGDDQDLVRWGHLSPYQLQNRFAFMYSKREATLLRTRLASGETVTMRAHVRAKIVPATLDVVTATIPGTDLAQQEIILTAHLCHQSAGANDDASGSAAIFEAMRALQSAIARGALPKPRRTLRVLWLPEISGSEAVLVEHPDIAKRMVAGVHMDMVGGLLSTTKGTFHLSRSAESLPNVISDVAAAWFDQVVRASSEYAEHGGDPYRGFVWLPGSREMFLGDMRKLEMGSDHEVYQEKSFGVPMVYFHDWPDVTIHTNKDLPENLDATKLGRVAYLGAGIAWTMAALPDSEAPRLLAVARASAERMVADARLKGVLSGAPDSAVYAREAAAVSAATLRSMTTFWPVTTANAKPDIARFTPTRSAPASTADVRVPVRNPEIRGPLDLYYYDHLHQTLGLDADLDVPLLHRDDGAVLAYEALNLADGVRNIGDIRDVLTGRYAPVAVSDVAGWFELLERAKVVELKGGKTKAGN